MYKSNYFESDQKDIIIAQLKADIFEAQKQNDDALMMTEEIRKMEVKIKLALDEKSICEQEHRARHDQALRQINSLNAEIAQLQRMCQDRELEQDKQAISRDKLAEMNDQKQLELQSARREFNQLSDNILVETQHLENMQDQMSQFEYATKSASIRNMELAAKLTDLQQQNTLKDNHLKILLQKVAAVSGNQLDQDIKKYQQELAELNVQIREVEEEAIENKSANHLLEQQIHQLKEEVQYLQRDLLKNKKISHLEQTKKTDLQNKVEQIGKQLDIKQQQQQQSKEELEQIQLENEKIVSTNKQMKEDWKALQKHIDVLMNVNTELVNELEGYSQDDGKIRQILNRSNRVKELQLRVTTGQRLTRQTKPSPAKPSPAKQQYSAKKSPGRGSGQKVNENDPTGFGMYSKMGRMAAEKYGIKVIRKKITPKVITELDDSDLFLDEVPLVVEAVSILKQKPKQKSPQPFSRSISRLPLSRDKTPSCGHYYPRYQSVQKRTTHVLPFEAYKARNDNSNNTSLQQQARILLECPNSTAKKTKGFVELAKQIPRPRCKTQMSEFISQQSKPNTRSVHFDRQSGHKLFGNTTSNTQMLYSPKYDFVFKKTVYVGAPFDSMIDRPDNINKYTCLNQSSFDQLSTASIYPKNANPDLPSHMQKNIGSRLQLTCLNEKMLETNYSLKNPPLIHHTKHTQI